MATTEQKLSSEQKELVAVGASVGAGCHPCADHHLKAGARAGLDDERLLAAVTSASRVAAEAAVLMDDHVRGKLGSSVTGPALLSRLEEALVSLGAALGANDARNIERQLRTALELGVSRPQLEQAIETAKTVQESAARIHVREAERLLDALATHVDDLENEADSGDGCGCGTDDESKAPAPGAQPADPMSERPPVVAPAKGCGDSIAELVAAVGRDEMTGFADAMANCRRMFAGAGATATEAAGPCRKEA